MTQLPSEGTPPSSVGATTPSDQFFHNATLGLNHWWRWVLGFIAIVLIWIGVGSIVLILAGCAFLESANPFGLSCSAETGVTGEGSLLAQLALGGTGFVIGLIGLWAVVKLIHKKNLMQVVTGRASFGYSRYLSGMLAALFISIVILLANIFILQTEVTFQAPNWGYLHFLLFAVVFVPIQTGFEELFFRGYILHGLIQLVKNKLVLAILTGIIFALPHLTNPEASEFGIATFVIALTSSGIFFALITMLDGGIELAMGYHAMSNLFMGLVANTEVAVIETPSLLVIHTEGYALFPNVFMEVLGLALAVVILNYKYKWFKLGNR